MITVLKIAAAVLAAALIMGLFLVKYALNQGMHVPTNDEIITSVKAANEARKIQKKEEKIVKPENIKNLKSGSKV